ncbi:MAG: Flp pilus assembly protein CpaB [Thermosipho sp. (in: Bacteria)]|nr:Flp pilus assembly protein CpaB [Thermosipho sp. (in: thermotogales)]
MALKRSSKFIIALIVGFFVAGVSVYYLLNYAANYQELTQIVVPKEEIGPYVQITSNQIKIKSVPVGSIGENIAVDSSQVIGKVTTVPLYPGEQIRLERLADKEIIDANKHHVGININLTRSVGGTIAPGDLVDVYWIQNNFAPGSLLAENARVLKVMDNAGRPVNKSYSENVLEQAKGNSGLPAVVVLAVDADEVPGILRGSADESKNIVLVKKLKAGENHDKQVDRENIAKPSAPVSNAEEQTESGQDRQETSF